MAYRLAYWKAGNSLTNFFIISNVCLKVYMVSLMRL